MSITLEEFKRSFDALVGSASSDTLASRKELLEAHLKRTGRMSTGEDDLTQKDRAEKTARRVLESVEKSTQDSQLQHNRRLDKAIKLKDDDTEAKVLEIEAQKLLVTQKGELYTQTMEEIATNDGQEPRDTQLKLALKAALEAKEKAQLEIAKLTLDKKRLDQEKKALKDQKSRLTHAVSAHGTGTQQEDRVLYGRRSDEAPPTGMPRTVGSDPSNTSGAFTSDQGMLNVVNEAFAQASQVTQFAKKTGSTLDQERLVTMVEGDGRTDGIGYNLEVEGMSTQKSGDQLQSDEIAERRKHIKRTENLKNARVVLDPSFVDGKQVGWNLQTAFATDDDVDDTAPLLPEEDGIIGSWTREVLPPSDPVARKEWEAAWHKRLMVRQHEEQLAEGVVSVCKEDLDLVVEQLALKEAGLKTKMSVVAEKDRDITDKLEELSTARAASAEKHEELNQSRDDLDPVPDEVTALLSMGSLVEKADLTATERDFFGLDELQLQEMTPKALAEHKIETLESLKQELDAALDDCYEERDMFDFDSPLEFKDDCEDLSVVLNTAYQYVERLITQATKLKEKARLDEVRSEKLEETEPERLRLENDPDHQRLLLEKVAKQEALLEAKEKLKEARKEAYVAPDPTHVPTPQSGYSPASGQYEASERPAKPGILKGIDEDYDSLTAHHLYPWNKIRDDLNRALKKQDRAGLSKLLAFGEYTPKGGFWDEFDKEPGLRSYTFTSDINTAAQMICWSPKNIFMGPSSSKRGDDPGEELDESFINGEQTLSTKLAELIQKQGGMGEVLEPDDVKAHLEAEEQRKKKADPSYTVQVITDDEIVAEVSARVRESLALEALEAALKVEKISLEKLAEEAGKSVSVVREERLAPLRLAIEADTIDEAILIRREAARQIKLLMATRDQQPQTPQPYSEEEWEERDDGLKVRKKD